MRPDSLHPQLLSGRRPFKNNIVEILGLLIELVFLALAIYLYLFSIGKIKTKDESLQQKGDAFREKNGTWLRILSLAMTIIMLINVLLHLKQLWMS